MKKTGGYIGTYTQDTGNGRAEGIYAFDLNPANGAIDNFRLAARSPNPSYLAVSPSKKYLYAVNELKEFEGSPSGAVSAFALEDTGTLAFLNQKRSEGTAPCHIAINAAADTAVVSNYTSGTVAVFPLEENGRLADVAVVMQLTGSGPDRERQAASHAHSFVFDPGSSRGFACDLGADRIMAYLVAGASLKPMEVPWFSSNPGAGPRHGIFHPSGKYAYFINELDSTVDALKLTPSAAACFKRIQTISVLPSWAAGSGNTGAAIKCSPDGRFLYASNRGIDSIAVYRIRGTGRLDLLEIDSSGGVKPRDFAIDPTGQFLVVCHQDSDNLAVFSIDPRTGRLNKKGEYPAPSGVCVVFV
jgi:6-phosphogluconolactonase